MSYNSKYFDRKPGSLENAVLEALGGQINETNKNDKSDDGEGMDAVQPKAVKKKFKDRKDKDIDNDGDVDSSDEYLHKRRKAISKAVKSEGIFTGLQKKGSDDSQAGAQTRSYQRQYGQGAKVGNPHRQMEFAKAAFKNGMKSRSRIVSYVEKETKSKIHPDVQSAINNSVKKEEVELDEVFNGTKKDIRKIARATDNALRKRSTQIQKMLKSKTNEKGRGLTDFEFDHISDEGDAIAAELVYRKKRGKDPISDDIPSHLKKFVNEEVDLDEDFGPLFYALWGTGAMLVLPALMIYDVANRNSNYKLDAKVGEIVGKLLSKFKKDKNYKPNSAEIDASKKLEKEVKSKEPSIFNKAMSKLKSIKSKKEEVDLDEAKGTTKYVVMQGPGDNNQKVIATFDGGPKALEKAKKFRDDWNKKNKSKIKLNKKGKPITAHMARIFDKGVETSYKVGDKVSYSAFAPSIIKDEVELDEGKMSQLHQYIKDKKSPEQIAKLMKLDVKTVKALMNSHHPEEVEESAASDARRAMRRDKDFSRRDSADDDTDATADDVKGASKNIMMQMRKAQSLNGRFDVEFGDGKKVKIPAKMAMAVQSKYNKMRRPAEKEKFQAKVGKSYRDMLSALKEEVKPKKESVLDRIDRKIKEKNDG